MAQQQQGRAVGPVQVVEHDQHRHRRATGPRAARPPPRTAGSARSPGSPGSAGGKLGQAAAQLGQQAGQLGAVLARGGAQLQRRRARARSGRAPRGTAGRAPASPPGRARPAPACRRRARRLATSASSRVLPDARRRRAAAGPARALHGVGSAIPPDRPASARARPAPRRGRPAARPRARAARRAARCAWAPAGSARHGGRGGAGRDAAAARGRRSPRATAPCRARRAAACAAGRTRAAPSATLPCGCERLHQQHVARLAIGLGLDQGCGRRARTEPSCVPPRPQAGAADHLERLQPEVVELAPRGPPAMAPGRPGSRPAAGDVERHLGQRPGAAGVAALQRLPGPPDLVAGRLDVDPGRLGQLEHELVAARPAPTAPSAERSRESSVRSAASWDRGALSGHSAPISSSRPTARSRFRTR